MPSPTELTLKQLRKEGWICEVVEHWNHHAKCKQDLFGCVDVIAFNALETRLVQATSASNVAARVKKCRQWPGWSTWKYRRDRRFQVWGWRERTATSKLGKGDTAVGKNWIVRKVEV